MRRPPPLKHADFRSLWLAGLISDGGDWLLFIALPILVYTETGSALGTSVAFLIELAPGILLAPVAGWLADRSDRRRLLLVLTLLQAVSLLPLAIVHGRGGLPIIYGVILVQASLAALFDPAKNALLPTLLPVGELVSANALVSLNQNFGRLIGGPLGGLLLAAGDLRLIVFADATTYLLAALLIGRLGPDKAARASPSENGRGMTAPGGGLLSAVRDRGVRAGLFVTFIGQIAQGIFIVLFVLFVAQRLHGGAGEIGLTRGVQAIGALAAGLVLSSLSRNCSPAKLTASAAICFGVIDLVVWNFPQVSTAPAIYVALFVIIGIPGVVIDTGIVSALQVAGAERRRGRIFGALGLTGNAGQVIGILAAGLLTPALGLMTMLNTQASLYLAAGLVAARWMTNPGRDTGSPLAACLRLAGCARECVAFATHRLR
jgi:MFS family permease